MDDIVRGRRASAAVALAVFGIVAGVYVATFSYRGITDTELNSLQTRSLVLHGDVDLRRYGVDATRFTGSGGNLLIEREGHEYSVYGVGVSLAAAPVYAVLTRLGVSEPVLQGTVAIMFSAGAAAVLALLLVKLVPPPVAVGSVVVFAFGTTLWPVASTALFQQGPVLFFETLALLGLFSRRPRGATLAGAGFALAALVRPTAAVPLVIVGVYYLFRGRKPLLLYCSGAVLPLAVILVQNRWIWGSWTNGGYSHLGVPFETPFGEAIGGLLISWWRGLFVYSPFLALAAIGWVLAMRRAENAVERRLGFLGISVLVTILVYSRWADWGGGINQFGYRLQLEVVPFLLVLGAYALTRLPKLAFVAVPLAAAGILTMTAGAARRRDGWDDTLFAREIGDTSFGRAWSNFFDHPGQGMTRVVLVAAAIAIIVFIVAKLPTRSSPAFAGAGHE
jgi:hypothetical protein